MNNWRDVYEEKDAHGRQVVFVYEKGSGRYAYIDKKDDLFTDWNRHLIKKPKPKKYRPFTIDEVKCGMVFRLKGNEDMYSVTLVSKSTNRVYLGPGGSNYYSLQSLFTSYEMPDGSPAGMLED